MTPTQWDMIALMQKHGGQAWLHELEAVVPKTAAPSRLRNDVRALVDAKMMIFVRRTGLGQEQRSLYRLTGRGLAYADARPVRKVKPVAVPATAQRVPEDYQPQRGDKLFKGDATIVVETVDPECVYYALLRTSSPDLGHYFCPVSRFRVHMIGSGAKLQRTAA